MKEWNNLSREDRILSWRDFRESLDPHSKSYLQDIADYFMSIPLSKSYIDYYTPISWPIPWEILNEGIACINTVSLLIYYTVTLTSNDLSAELLLVEDTDTYLLPLIDGEHVLNYNLGSIVNKHQLIENAQITQTYTQNEIKNIE